jgi:hypothetical protein
MCATGGSVQKRYHYTAPALAFACRLVSDEAGLVPDAPGVAADAGTPGRNSGQVAKRC